MSAGLSLKKRFFVKYLGVLTLCIIVPLLVFALTSSFVLHSYLMPIQEQNAQMLADQISTSLESDFHEFETFVLFSTVSARPKSIVTRLLSSQSFEYEDLLLLNDMKDQLATIRNRHPFLQEIAIWFPNAQGCYLSDAGKKEVASQSSWLDSFPLHASDYRWWTVRDERPRFDGKMVPSIYLCHRVGGGGMVSFMIDPSLLAASLSSDFLKRGEVLKLYSEQGDLLFSTRAASLDDSYLSYGAEEAITGWKIQLFFPKAIVFALTDRYKILVFACISLTFVGSLFIALYMARRNTRQISQMLDMIHLSKQGLPLPKLRDDVPKTTYAYISRHLLASFLEKNYLKTLLEARRYKLAHAELVAMQSQLNPHFLYNTLETLNWNCYQLTSKPNQATDIIEKLSDILHYSLGKNGLFVTLDDELQDIHNYLDILLIRYKDLFSYHEEICDEARIWKIPRMILQPLVENAVAHGLKPRKHGGLLSITARLYEGLLVLEVTDNGIGFSALQLSQIRQNLGKESLGDRHIGISNVNLRLVILYGKHLEIESEEGKGTRVTLRIPPKELENVPVDDC